MANCCASANGDKDAVTHLSSGGIHYYIKLLHFQLYGNFWWLPTITNPPILSLIISSVCAKVKVWTWSSSHFSWLIEVMNLQPVIFMTLAHWSNLLRGMLNKKAKLFRQSSFPSWIQLQVNSRSPAKFVVSPVITDRIFFWINYPIAGLPVYAFHP